MVKEKSMGASERNESLLVLVEIGETVINVRLNLGFHKKNKAHNSFYIYMRKMFLSSKAFLFNALLHRSTEYNKLIIILQKIFGFFFIIK